MNSEDDDKTSIEGREQQARIDKLLLEQEILRQKISPEHQFREKVRAYTGLVGLISAFVAVGGLLLTLWQAAENFNVAERERTADRFERALNLLVSDSANQRVSGVQALSSFATEETLDYHRRALVSVANLMPLEQHPVVLSAMRNIFINHNIQILPADLLREVHEILIDSNRTILRENPSLVESHIYFVENRSKFDKCLDLLELENSEQLCDYRRTLRYLNSAIIKLIESRSDVVDLSEIYCPYCNFSEIEMNEFLFSGSYLANADFTRAKLDGASFQSAFLIGTSFNMASLRNADFSVPEVGESYVRKNFSIHMGQETVYGPDFYCADLSNALFAGHPVFRFHSAKQREYFADLGPIFRSANLTSTDFSHINIYAVTDTKIAPFENNSWTHPIMLPNGFFFVEWPLEPESASRLEAESPYLPYLQLGFGLRGANWQDAVFPKGIKELLEKDLPELQAPEITCE